MQRMMEISPSSPPSPDALILEAQADFALNLMRELSKNGNSCIVSPFSVAIALSMVYVGAKEKTSKEMGQLLAKGAPESEVHKYFGALLNAIKNGQNNYTLEVANKVYVKDGFEVLDAFKAQIAEHYGGQFEAVDFGDSVGAAKKINTFVEEATHEKIHDLISSDSLGELTRLVLINANSKELDMMHKKDDFIYFEDDQLQLLGMPYQGENVFMFVMLPKESFGLAKLLAELDGKKLLELTKKRGKREVQVVLPKFKLESTHQLNKPLANMGMATAFSDSANFEGIANGPLKISEVVQKAFIEVNEQGTEAAAATIVHIATLSLMIEPPPPQFVADRPFVAFLVNHSQTVNEKGTVAAAATVMSHMTIRPQIRPPPPQFVADRPFVAFLVNHSQTVSEKGTEAAAATAVLIMVGSFIRPPPPQFVADRPFVAFLVNHSQTVNEKGTEAAAATAVLIMNGSFEIRPPPPQFVADRPFVAFLVNHSQTLNEKGTEASAATAVIVEEEASGPIEPEPALFIANRPFLMALTSSGNKILFTGMLQRMN
ncbi:hypothetical protein niasHT_028634 [Heterodera trifolii]|uniref:Serpin domain-containing protein n=1 Tax=Heterodera trifolii TaxID=157864 RepID=A0ABD2KBP6_9BILA